MIELFYLNLSIIFDLQLFYVLHISKSHACAWKIPQNASLKQSFLFHSPETLIQAFAVLCLASTGFAQVILPHGLDPRVSIQNS